MLSCSVMSDSLQPQDCSPSGSSVHGDSPGKNTAVGYHALFQEIFPTEGSNPGLPHCRQILYHLIHQGSPWEDIKKRWQEYTKELWKQRSNDQDNHDDVFTHLESDIQQCEVKWSRLTMSKASGGEGIPAELFNVLKDDAVIVLHSICQQVWNISSGHRTGKGQFSLQSQRRAMPKHVQTTVNLQSLQILVRLFSKSFKLGFSSMWTKKFQKYTLGFKEAEEPEIKFPEFIFFCLNLFILIGG